MQTTTEKMNQILSEVIQIEDKSNLLTLLRTQDFGTYSQDEIMAEFQRRKDLEPKPLTVLQQLEFITANDPEHEKYKIEEVFKSCFDKALSKLLPYTHFSGGCNYLLTKWKIDYCLPLAENAKNFEAYVTGTIGLNIEDFTLYYYEHSLFGSYYFRKDSDKHNQYSMKSEGYINLVQFVQFLVHKCYEPDYKKAYEFADNNTPKICYSNQAAYEYKYGNIIVKRFMNGRIDLKGLTEAQNAIINKCLEIHEIIRRF